MKNKVLIMRYVKPLYELGKEKGIEVKISKELEMMAKGIKQAKVVERFFNNPTVNKKDKLEKMRYILDKITVSKLVEEFLFLLIKKNRIRYLYDIAVGYNQYLLKAMGKIAVKILFAKKPSLDRVKQIGKVLQHKLEKKVVITYQIRPNLIGGFVVIIGDKLIDASLNRKIELMVKHLSEK